MASLIQTQTSEVAHILPESPVTITSRNWKDIVAKKQAQVAAKIPQEWMLSEASLNTILSNPHANVLDVPKTCGVLSPEEVEITESYDATALGELLSTRRLTSLEVAIAFCKRAVVAHQLTNCLTEIFIDVAIERARYLDEYFEREGKPVGLLHGLPISLKDTFNIEGIASTIGYALFVEHDPPSSNSALVDILLSQGAVLYVKTNIPQTLMSAECENNVFGRTMNPRKISLSPGGSSGGEGALVALRGSLIGIGGDIGGSVRIPALCCGTFGFKPTANRLPFSGQTIPGKPGNPGIEACAGPLTTSARDIQLLLESLFGSQAQDLDSCALSIPYQKLPVKERLTIGVILEDPGIPVTPPVLRAIRSAALKLEQAGHSVTMLGSFPDFNKLNDLALEFFDLDDDNTGFQCVLDSGEPMVPSVQWFYDSRPRTRPPRMLSELFTLNQKRTAAIARWNKLFVDGGFDCLIAPGAAHTAVPYGEYRCTPYTAMWNLVDYPACTVPYGQADASVDLAEPHLKTYDPIAVDGAPTSIQVIARHMQDEALVASVRIIADVLA